MPAASVANTKVLGYTFIIDDFTCSKEMFRSYLLLPRSHKECYYYRNYQTKLY